MGWFVSKLDFLAPVFSNVDLYSTSIDFLYIETDQEGKEWYS